MVWFGLPCQAAPGELILSSGLHLHPQGHKSTSRHIILQWFFFLAGEREENCKHHRTFSSCPRSDYQLPPLYREGKIPAENLMDRTWWVRLHTPECIMCQMPLSIGDGRAPPPRDPDLPLFTACSDRVPYSTLPPATSNWHIQGWGERICWFREAELWPWAADRTSDIYNNRSWVSGKVCFRLLPVSSGGRKTSLWKIMWDAELMVYQMGTEGSTMVFLPTRLCR